jgi:uncharacterized protein YjbJ (UPF0337 family)
VNSLLCRLCPNQKREFQVTCREHKSTEFIFRQRLNYWSPLWWTKIVPSAEQAKGKVKEVVGKVTGDRKLASEGKAGQVKGKIQNAVGGLKDSLRGK